MTALARWARGGWGWAAGVLLASAPGFADVLVQIPGKPLLPTSRAQCEAYSRDLEARYSTVDAQHQQCLDARARTQEPRGRLCSKAGCEALHQLKEDLSEARAQGPSSCFQEVSRYEQEQRARLDSLNTAQRRAEDLADRLRAEGAAPPPEPPALDAATAADRLAALLDRRSGSARSGLAALTLPSLSFQNPFSDKTGDALRNLWQQDGRQLVLDGMIKGLGDHPLASGLDTALSGASTFRGVLDFLRGLDAARTPEDRFDRLRQGVGAAVPAGAEFAAGRGWLPPSYAVSGFAFEHALSALHVATRGSLERLQSAFDLFDAGGARGWDAFDRLTDFNTLGRDIVLEMCPLCGTVLRLEAAATSTYEEVARWHSH